MTGALALEGRARLWVGTPEGITTITEALSIAQTGDVICVVGGAEGTTFTENVNVRKAVHLEAVGDVTIDGGGMSPALVVSDGADSPTIKGFTLTNAEDCRDDGDCRVLEVSSSPVIEDVLIYGGEAEDGAGIYIFGGSPSFQDVEVMWAGSEAEPFFMMKVEKERLDPDHMYYSNVLLELLEAQKLTIKRSALHTHARQYTHPLVSTAIQATQVNHAYPDPGFDIGMELQPSYACAQMLADRHPTAAYRTTYTTTANHGGAIYVASGSPTFTNLIVTDSAATYGAALYVAGGTVTVDHGTLLSPDASISGVDYSAVYVAGGSLRLYNSLVRGNTSTTVIYRGTSGSIIASYSAFWAEGDLDATLSGITLTSSRTTLDPWWCTQPSDLSLPSTADDFFTNPDGDRGTADYVGAVSPYQD